MKVCSRLLCLLSFCFSFHPFLVQAGVTISPASMNSSYIGAVTLSATVPTGSLADIDIFLDMNRNGSVGSEDMIFRHFTVQDGQWVPPAGAALVTDTDGQANGVINARILSFPDEAICGQLIARVKAGSSTSTAKFTVSTPSGSQSVSGQISLNGTAKPGSVMVFKNGEHLYGVLTDSSGRYTATFASAGTYRLCPMIIGEVQYFDSAVDVTVTAGQNKTNVNLNLNRAPYRWAGKIVNSANSAGVPYCWLLGESEDESRRFVGITDANGNFDIRIDSGNWQVEVDMAETRGFHYDEIFNDDEPLVIGNASVTGQTYEIEPISGFVTATIKNGKTLAPVMGAALQASEPGERDFDAEAGSNADGKVALGLAAGTWTVRPALFSDMEPPLELLFPAATYTTVTISGSPLVYDLGTYNYIPVEGKRLVTVIDDETGMPIEDVQMNGIDFKPTSPYQSTSAFTNANGVAEVGIRNNNSWHILFTNIEEGRVLPPPQRLDILAAKGNVVRVYPLQYRTRPYRVYGGNTLPASGGYPQDSGFVLLGEATTTRAFSGSYSYYYVVTYDGKVLIDSVRGFSGSYLTPAQSSASSNISQISGKPNGSYATIGEIGGQPMIGYVSFHPSTKPQGIIVYHPDNPKLAAEDWDLYK